MGGTSIAIFLPRPFRTSFGGVLVRTNAVALPGRPGGCPVSHLLRLSFERRAFFAGARQEGKRALMSWDAGDFQPILGGMA